MLYHFGMANGDQLSDRPLSGVKDLTPRQKRYLNQAYELLSDGEISDLDYLGHATVIDIVNVGEHCEFKEAESDDIAKILVNEFRYFTLTSAYQSKGTEPKRLKFTNRGREAARQLVDDRKAAKRERVWNVVKAVWVIAVSISVPVTTALLNRRIERVEKQNQQPTPATQPTTQP